MILETMVSLDKGFVSQILICSRLTPFWSDIRMHNSSYFWCWLGHRSRINCWHSSICSCCRMSPTYFRTTWIYYVCIYMVLSSCTIVCCVLRCYHCDIIRCCVMQCSCTICKIWIIFRYSLTFSPCFSFCTWTKPLQNEYKRFNHKQVASWKRSKH